MMTPAEIDLTGFSPFESKFGCHEFERAIEAIVRFIRDLPNKPNHPTPWQFHPKAWGRGDEWETRFMLHEVDVSASVMCALAAAGWIEHIWFPKWTFKLSAPAVERICRPRYAAALSPTADSLAALPHDSGREGKDSGKP